MKIPAISKMLTALLAAAVSGCSQSTADIPAVTNFVPERYMGEWFEIARLPHRFERNLDYVRAEYALAPDGTIEIVNRGVRDGEERSITGKAKLKDASKSPLKGELRVSFFWPFYSDYRIIELDPEYRHAVVTGSDRDYLWILSRTPTLPREKLAALLERLEKLDFDVSRLEYPRQK